MEPKFKALILEEDFPNYEIHRSLLNILKEHENWIVVKSCLFSCFWPFSVISF